MTEIDFIPGWYQARRSRKLWYHRQVFIICLGAFVTALWCLAAGRGLSQARAQLQAANTAFESGIGKIQQREKLMSRYTQLQKQTRILDSIVPRTPYSAVLAELSCCIAPEVVIRTLNLYSEPIVYDLETAAGKGGKLNLANGADKKNATRPVTQTCILLNGYAADAKQVAVLIAALEQSEYFFRVIPTYSKNQKVNGQNVSEFEIRCVLADYELSGEKDSRS